MEELYPNYLWQVPVTKDLAGWNELWPGLEQQILSENKGKSYALEDWPETTALYRHYNIFTIEDPNIEQLQSVVRETVKQVNPNKEFYIRGWLNVLRDQNTLNWHDHAPDIVGAMHGYISISSEPSVTVYRIGEDLLNVKNRNGYIVIGYSNRDKHRTTPMPSDTPRVSVAFDIVPTTYDLPASNKWLLL